MGDEPTAVVERLLAAMNAHDLDAMVACIADDYNSDQPAHPDRRFSGSAQMRENWRSILEGVPDFRAELVAGAAEGEVVFSEWRWSGTRVDGTPVAIVGVTVFGVRDGRIRWGRLYMEDVAEGAGIESAVRDIVGGE